ncbi:flotillin [Paragonimus westermani]|uniref:Flotillin n=1 Tax=Paragonimus westermani TaxID=34504 RepID=A0A5J4NUD8_9TREM|nr:flotillin [Paragonimus westermani]
MHRATLASFLRIPLNTMTLLIESPRIYTQLGVPITVTGVAQVKVNGSNQEMLAAACEQFLGKTDTEIRDIAQETLEGHQRAIMGNMTVEEIYKDRKKFSKAVFEVASSDLVNMGISVVSYTLKDIKDDEGYLNSLGLARTAQVKCDARIGEAEARRDAGIREAEAEKQRVAGRLLNDIEIAKAKRDFELQNASYEKEVQTRKAVSELAYELQAAKTRQQIKEEEMQILLLERTQQIKVEELENLRQEHHLDATIRKPAEAERFRLERLAEADRLRLTAEAEAEAESIRLKGLAEAEALQIVAQSEAEQMMRKAEAWKAYKGAAKLEMVLQMLPKLAAEISAPLAQCDKVTMVTTGDGEIGISKLTGEVLTLMSRLPSVIHTMTGVDVTKAMQAI